MAAVSRSRRRTFTWIGFAALALFMALVIYRSFHVASYQCRVCMTFQGQQGCGTVEAQTEHEARSGAINNACAQISSGVTDSMACERGQPLAVDCSGVN